MLNNTTVDKGNIYAIILEHNKVNYQNYVHLLTDSYGFIYAKAHRYSPSKQNSASLIHLQPLNLIETLLVTQSNNSSYYQIQDSLVKYIFYPEIVYFHQWNILSLLSSLSKIIYFSEIKENKLFFSMTLEFLYLASTIKTKEQSYQLCFIFFVKTLLILKIIPHLIYCIKCLKLLFSNKNFSKEIFLYNHHLYCNQCLPKSLNQSLLYPISDIEYQYLYRIIFNTLKNSIENIIPQDILFSIQSYIDLLISNHFHKTWSDIIKSTYNSKF